jgi:thymidylate synthase ThyX
MNLIEGKNRITATVVADSINPSHNARLVTLALHYPRFVHAEFMTHRMFSRNASSSRAIPVEKMVERVRKHPAKPVEWGKNKPGMQAHELLDERACREANHIWNETADMSADQASRMSLLGVHKQIANRLLEPYQYMYVVVSATEWDNFFALRCHPDADPTMQELANTMKRALDHSISKETEWHLPFLSERDHTIKDITAKIAISVARCARVSYVKHDGTASTPADDMVLYQRLLDSGHMSPFEHVATPMAAQTGWWENGVTHTDSNRGWWSGNFRGWIQHRHRQES